MRKQIGWFCSVGGQNMGEELFHDVDVLSGDRTWRVLPFCPLTIVVNLKAKLTL